MAESKQQPMVPIPGRRARGGPGAFVNKEKPKDIKNTVKRLLQYFAKEKKQIVILFLIVGLSVICNVLAPAYQSNAINYMKDRRFEKIPGTLWVMFSLYLIYGICNLFQGLISAALSQNIVKRMRDELFDKIIHLPVKYLDTHTHGDIMSRMTNDVENISNVIAQSLSSLFSGVLTIIGTVVIMVYYSWQLALLSLSTVILTILATKYMSDLMRKLFRKRQSLLGELNGAMEEKVVGLKTVTAYNKQQDTIAEFEKISDQLTQTGIKAEIIGGATGPVMNCINNIGFVIIAAFGGYFSYKGMISLGVISAFIIYAKQFSRPINEMAQLYAQIQTAFAGAERVFEIMDQPNEDKSGSEKMPTIGNISFEHVDFSYLPGKQVLRDFTLDVKTGQKVALVGATGSGKTTVVNLLMRFYDIDAGKIFLDGVDIQKIPREELRKEVAIVLQDTLLFADTVRNNLLFANEQATEEELERAVIIGNCKKVIQHLPYGYETKLSENGANLSQGQRQLLAIGRAALASPTILILDEATSSVDTRTEKHIQDAMVKLMEGRTSLIIAHRLSTIMDADLIAVMDQGHIVELGNHEQLLRKHGRYYELYMTQFSGQSI